MGLVCFVSLPSFFYSFPGFFPVVYFLYTCFANALLLIDQKKKKYQDVEDMMGVEKVKGLDFF